MGTESLSDHLRIGLANETDGPGGAEMLVIQLAEELRGRGHEVVPILPTRLKGWLHDHLADRGFRFETVELVAGTRWSCTRDLWRLLRKHDLQVLHSHEFTMAVFGAAASRAAGVRHVITMHGNQTMLNALRRRVALRGAFRWSHATVAVSEDTRAHLINRLGLLNDSVLTIRNGIPRRSGEPEPVRTEFGVVDGSLLVLAVGGLHKRKGHALLIEALARLQMEGRVPTWKLVIAGAGPEHDRLLELVRSKKLEGQVYLPGQREDIPALQAAADIFVMPSLWEGLPLAVLEAMLASTPVIASRTSGIPEAISHEEDGLLVEPGDVDDLALALERLMNSAELRERLGNAGRSRGEREFTIERMADEYERLYRGGLPR